MDFAASLQMKTRARRAGAAAILTLAWLAPVAAEESEPVASLRGCVVDARTGEPISKALVSVRDRKVEATTDAQGRFALTGLPLGEAEISVTTVGYGLVHRAVRVELGVPDIEIRLDQDALKRAEEITVETPAYEPTDPSAPAEHTLAGVELKNLASVLADDPLRSVQALPGVASADDFSATFAVRGSGFASTGLYVDGVLLAAPFHMVRDVNDSFSLTILNGDVVESLSLLSSGAPAKYGDRTGAVLSVRTREGSRQEFFGRASLGATGLHATLEGPLGRARKTSWLVSVRKSYVDYVLNRIEDAPAMVLGYHDATAKLAHHPTASQVLSLLLVHGRSRWRSTESDIEPDDLHTADAGTDLAWLDWRLLPSASSWLEAAVFFSRETGRNRALDGTDRFRSAGSQWGLRSDATRVVRGHQLEAGVLLRGLAEEAIGRDFDPLLRTYRTSQSYDDAGAQWGGPTCRTPGGRRGASSASRWAPASSASTRSERAGCCRGRRSPSRSRPARKPWPPSGAMLSSPAWRSSMARTRTPTSPPSARAR